MKNLIILLVIFTSSQAIGQANVTLNTSYPTNYFNRPLDIPLLLSGTFGELRTSHIHAGLDLKTQQKEGLNVMAAAEGYISRIKISLFGYGKVLYITHPNGYTTVYAHLKKFNKKIEAYIKKHQYQKESFEIHVFPKPTDLLVSKNEIIALSGATGGFVGPHLHFEIRNTKTEKPINPLFFGIEIMDSKIPRINTLLGYALNTNSHINQLNSPSQLNFKKLNNGDLLASKINAFGKIGFGINSYDQQDGAYNKNGLYSLEMIVNGQKIYDFKAASFSFSESKYINLLIDYKRYEEKKQRIQKCFVEPENKLSLNKNTGHNGYLNIEDGMSYNVQIIAKDYVGNTQKITIPIIGKKTTILAKKKELQTPYKIKYTDFNKFNSNGVTIAFPKKTFYKNFYLDFKVTDSTVTVHKPIIPLSQNYTLTFDVTNYTEDQKNQLYIASISKDGKSYYVSTQKKDKTFYTSTKVLGDFKLLTDSIPPTIELKNIRDQQWISNFKQLTVKISDAESGVKSYRGEIDGAWILMEYNIKNGLLTYDLNDKKFTEAKHNIKVVVTDNVGNTNEIEATFFRKK